MTGLPPGNEALYRAVTAAYQADDLYEMGEDADKVTAAAARASAWAAIASELTYEAIQHPVDETWSGRSADG